MVKCGMESLARRIAAARVGAGLSQAGLAKHVHLSQSDISKFERGHKQPGIETLRGIATATNQPMSYFIGDDPNTATFEALVSQVREALGDGSHYEPLPAQSWPGIEGLLGNEELRRSLSITDEEAHLLRNGYSLPVGPATVEEAIVLLQALRAMSARHGG